MKALIALGCALALVAASPELLASGPAPAAKVAPVRKEAGAAAASTRPGLISRIGRVLAIRVSPRSARRVGAAVLTGKQLLGAGPSLEEEARNKELEALVPRLKPPTLGQRVADRVAAVGGSWKFLLGFTGAMSAWMWANTAGGMHFDPAPFIGLNLGLSMMAALQAPVLLMASNRQGQRDRAQALADFHVNVKAEREVADLHRKIDTLQADLQRVVAALEAKPRAEAPAPAPPGGSPR